MDELSNDDGDHGDRHVDSYVDVSGSPGSTTVRSERRRDRRRDDAVRGLRPVVSRFDGSLRRRTVDENYTVHPVAERTAAGHSTHNHVSDACLLT